MCVQESIDSVLVKKPSKVLYYKIKGTNQFYKKHQLIFSPEITLMANMPYPTEILVQMVY